MMYKLTSKSVHFALSVGWLLGAAAVAQAQNPVTFQVDMTVQISNGAFIPGASIAYARGEFSGWAAVFPLTNNPSGPNTNLYTGTTNITGAAATDEPYKFYIDTGDKWENPASTGGGDRHFTLAGGAQTLPVVYFDDLPPVVPTNNVTFQVDMTLQVSLGNFSSPSNTVYAQGDFQDPPWTPTFVLTNNPAGANTNLFSGTYPVAAPVGSLRQYKFYYNPGDRWEQLTGGGNRQFTIAGGNQTLLPVYFEDKQPGNAVTNQVTFQVDLSAPILQGSFTPGVDTVEVRGAFNSWVGGAQYQLTNNPSGSNTNLYSGVFTLSDAPGAAEPYKYVIPPNNWEQPTSTGGGNRSFNLLSTNGPEVLPVVYFSDISPSDLLSADTYVTFSVNMTNAVGTDAHAFDPLADTVYMNGDFLNWLPWNSGSLAPYQLTNDGSSQIYSITLLVPRGNPIALKYKYSINGADNEAASGNNRVRFVRTVGNYTMPPDKFATMTVESSSINLQISASTPGHVLVSWPGSPGIRLQTRASLGNGTWEDHPETDGLSSTNWPATDASLFFRLVKP